MAVSADSVAVAGTAVALNTQGTAALDLAVKNVEETNPADLGSAGVTLGSGFELAAGETVHVRVDGGDQLFAIASAGAPATLRVLRT